MHDDTRPESLDSLPDDELLHRFRAHRDPETARELHLRHAAAFSRCFAGVDTPTAIPLGDVLARFLSATPSPAEREHPSLLLCRIAFELLAELPDDAARTPATDPIFGDGSERDLLEVALQRLPPRARAAILLHHHIVAATPELEATQVDARSSAQLTRARALLHASMEQLRTQYRARTT